MTPFPLAGVIWPLQPMIEPSRPVNGETNLVQIYLDCGELLELCRKAESGELLLRLQDKKQKGDKTPLYQCMGGTSAESCAG